MKLKYTPQYFITGNILLLNLIGVMVTPTYALIMVGLIGLIFLFQEKNI